MKHLTFILLMAGLLVLTGCQTKITGGTTQHITESQDQTEPEVTVTDANTGRVIFHQGPAYHVEREAVSTTQPSARGDGAFKLTESPGEGLLGGISFTPTVDKFKNAWPLGLFFLILGGGLCYPFHRYILGGVIIAAGCIVILNPALFVWMAIGSIVVVLWANWATVKDLVRGNTKLMEKSDPAVVPNIKAILQGEQSPSTQSAVKTAK